MNMGPVAPSADKRRFSRQSRQPTHPPHTAAVSGSAAAHRVQRSLLPERERLFAPLAPSLFHHFAVPAAATGGYGEDARFSISPWSTAASKS